MPNVQKFTQTLAKGNIPISESAQRAGYHFTDSEANG